jgi:hypothetical protein
VSEPFYPVPLIIKNNIISGSELEKIIDYAVNAPFTLDMLTVDESLWGSFWQGDVIGPGYRLPGVELALLRAVRLDGDWPAETTLPQYLADLRAAIRHPQAGVWTLTAAGEPCVILTAPIEQGLTVIWYCASTNALHAGYRTAAATLKFPGAVLQRPPGFANVPKMPTVSAPGWLASIEIAPAPERRSTAARLEGAILKIRSLTGG